MNKIKIFISYCVEDNDKMEFIKNLINQSEKLEAVVVLQEKSDLSFTSDKVAASLKKSDIFLPILTSKSISNQWVNQETGFVFGNNKFKTENIKPIIEKKIMAELKGFITANNDLNYKYKDNEDFEIQAGKLVFDLIEEYKNYAQYNIH